MISSPCFVWMVTFVIVSLLFGCSCVGSGRAGASCCVAVRSCFVALPSAMSSVMCRFALVVMALPACCETCWCCGHW